MGLIKFMEIPHSTEHIISHRVTNLAKGVPTYICMASRGQDGCGGVMFNHADPRGKSLLVSWGTTFLPD